MIGKDDLDLSKEDNAPNNYEDENNGFAIGEDNKDSLEEIDTEDEELELEEDELPNQIEDLEQQIKELKQQRDDEENDTQQEEEAVLEDEPEEEELDWPEPSKIEVTAKKIGKEWHAEATVNGKVFSVEQPGTKTQAVKDVRSAYKRYIEEL